MLVVQGDQLGGRDHRAACGRQAVRQGKIALALIVPRPDGTYDTGDAALSRLSVDEVGDPQTGHVLQEHVPSGVQFLTGALQSLERFFNLSRRKI